MIIGTAMLIRFSDKRILGLECSKKRGIILPGGKVEAGETYRQAAVRECQEECGIKVLLAKLVYQGFSSYEGTSYCYGYECRLFNPNDLYGHLGSDLGSGKIGLYRYDDFMHGYFAAYYDAMFQTIGITE